LLKHVETTDGMCGSLVTLNCGVIEQPFSKAPF
jgi:hypothetical protein